MSLRCMRRTLAGEFSAGLLSEPAELGFGLPAMFWPPEGGSWDRIANRIDRSEQ